ncbi:hypothetical protein [Ensifer aridi]|uniref:hypothetical protein n=1 Tax=Ensifer aridi TaxID=1708715 RepID=UPI00358F3AF5
MGAALRNIFDQYRHPENRLTHAFFSALDHDRTLLNDFLRVFVKSGHGQKAHGLSLSVQTIPGRPEAPEEDESDRRGIPDAWIHNGDDWCIVFESKINAPLSPDQIRRHIRIAAQLGFTRRTAVAITAHSAPVKVSDGVISTTWSQLYRWLRKHSDNFWARQAAGYFEALEARMIGEENFTSGTLTSFAGFPFAKAADYSYLEGRRVIKLATEALRRDKRLEEQLGVDPSIPGRSAITGTDEDFVWDYLSLRTSKASASHTNHPHLTLGVGQIIDVMITIPNAINTPFRRALIGLGKEGFRNLVHEFLSNMEAEVLSVEHFAAPTMRAIQRRYPSQRAVPFVDSLLEFDLRTAFDGGDPVKLQPEWLESAFAAFTHKNSNLQIQLGAKFEIKKCPSMLEESALDLIAKTWLAGKSLIDHELAGA